MKDRMKLILILLIVIVGFITVFSVSMAAVYLTVNGDKVYTSTLGKLNFELKNEENSIRLLNAYPVEDSIGQTYEPYLFSLENTGTIKLYYRISLIEDKEQMDLCEDCEFLSPDRIKFSVVENGVNGGVKRLNSKDPVIISGEINPGIVSNFELRLWLDEITTIEDANKYYYGKLKVETSQKTVVSEYFDDTNANVPVLTDGMIPVYYDETRTSWVKADIADDWYDYSELKWANAVTIKEEKRIYYMNVDPGTAIPIDVINTMWVWVPRYEYQYTNLSTNYAGGTADLPGEIKINFIKKEQVKPSDPAVYKIPLGFTFDGEELSGFWIGKFEPSAASDSTCAATASAANCNVTTIAPYIIPNVASWRYVAVGNAWNAIRLMQSDYADTYGFDSTNTGLDIHLSKNTEWGIVAMLSQSRYGKYGNENYTGANKEIYQNKSTSYITGSSNGTPGQSTVNTQSTYDTADTGVGASTTGTIYGIYDMSGGSWEYVMANLKGTIASSAFGAMPDAKYFDLYSSTTVADVYLWGDATYETSGWYNNAASFMTTTDSYYWLLRGGRQDTTTNAGIFNFTRQSGIYAATYSFRITLKP